MVFKDVATALQALMPNRKQSDIIHNAKNFKMGTTGPDRWWSGSRIPST